MSNRTRILLATLLIVGAIAWGVSYLLNAPQWQQFSAAEFKEQLSQANPLYLLLAAFFTFASYWFRCYRWREFVRPMKDASLWHLFVATVVGFSGVALFSRAGEIIRPWMIAQKENLPLTSQLGAWTLERVFDLLTLVGLVGAALWLFPMPSAEDARAAQMLEHFRSAGVVLTLGALALAGGLAVFRYFPEFTEHIILTLARPLPQRYRDALRRALEHFAATLSVIENGRRFGLCLCWSLLVWLTLLGAYWSVAQAFGEPTQHLGWSAMTLVMMASVTGSVAQLPAVGGGSQIATALALTGLLGVAPAPALGVAITVWVITFLLVLVPGIPLAVHEGLSWGCLRSLLRSPSSE